MVAISPFGKSVPENVRQEVLKARQGFIDFLPRWMGQATPASPRRKTGLVHHAGREGEFSGDCPRRAAVLQKA